MNASTRNSRWIAAVACAACAWAAAATEYQFVRAFGTPGIGSNEFEQMDGVAVDRFGNVFVSDVMVYPGLVAITTNQAVKRWTKEGVFSLSWFNHEAALSLPGDAAGIDCHCNGAPFYCAPFEGTMRNIEHTFNNGLFLEQFPEREADPRLRDVAVNADGVVYAVGTMFKLTQMLVRFAWDGTNWAMSYIEVMPTNGLNNRVWGVDADAWRGRVYVTVLPSAPAADRTLAGTAGVLVYDLDLNLLDAWPLWGYDAQPLGVAVDNRDGSFFVVDALSNMVYKYDAAGAPLTSWGGPGNAPSQFNHPTDVDVDMDGWVYVADRDNHRVQEFAPPRVGNLNFIVYKSAVKIKWKTKAAGRNADTVKAKGIAAIDPYTNITTLAGMPLSFHIGSLEMIPEMAPTKVNKKGTSALYKPDATRKLKAKFKPRAAMVYILGSLRKGNINADLGVADVPVTTPWLWQNAVLTLSNEYVGTHYMRLIHSNKPGKIYKAFKK
ncbi:hypothetical protein GX586_03500 [bacterium]|nr:hypothetical protein [bacterium]